MNRGGIRKSLTMLPLALTVAMDEHALSPVLPFDKHRDTLQDRDCEL